MTFASTSRPRIVVVGAGVAGLTTALLLSECKYNVTVVAKHQPGDYDIEYTSPWAGANFLPMSQKGSVESIYETDTYQELMRLAKSVPEAGIHPQDVKICNRNKDFAGEISPMNKNLIMSNPWYESVVDGYRPLQDGEIPANFDSGVTFKSVCINTAIYLPYLVSMCLKNGVVFKRSVLKHINEASNLHALGKKADVVVNCTGLFAAKLGGVEDKAVVPARGQIVLVRNTAPNMFVTSGNDDNAPDEICYIMTRAAGGGTILGGCYQLGSTSSDIDHNLANRIMRRCVEVCPELANGKGIAGLDIIRHGVGLRPVRVGGPRLEREVINGQKVVHNYGAGGSGYQTSYGMAQKVLRLVKESLAPQAKL